MGFLIFMLIIIIGLAVTGILLITNPSEDRFNYFCEYANLKSNIYKAGYYDIMKKIISKPLVKNSLYHYKNIFYDTEICLSYIKVDGCYWIPEKIDDFTKMMRFIVYKLPYNNYKPYVITKHKFNEMKKKMNPAYIINRLSKIIDYECRQVSVMNNYISIYSDMPEYITIDYTLDDDSIILMTDIYKNSILDDPIASIILYIGICKDFKFNHSNNEINFIIANIENIFKIEDKNIKYFDDETMGSVITKYNKSKITNIYNRICDKIKIYK